MGYQVVKQPDGRLAVFSSVTDTWEVYDGTPEEIEEFFVDLAVERARAYARRVIGHVVNDEPCRVYQQFTMTFEEADAESAEHGGATLAELRANPDRGGQPKGSG